MAVLLVIMVGKAGEWVPVVKGLPVLKFTFVLAAFYYNRVSLLYTPVRVGSLPLARLVLAFLTLSMVSIFFSVLKSNTLASSYASIIMLISFVMLVKTTQTLKDVERLLIGLAVAGCSLSIAVVFYAHGERAHINGNFDPNDLAYSLVTLLPIVLALRGPVRGLRRFVVMALAVIMCLAVLLTASRGGFLGLLVVMLAVAAFPLELAQNGWLKEFSAARFAGRVALAVLVGVFLLTFLPEKSKEHLSTLIHPEEDYNTSTTLNASRLVLWKRDTKLALERPIGYGMGSAAAVDGLYGHGQYRTVHNSVIQAFLELGVLGLYLYLASYYVAWTDLGRISTARQRDGPHGEGAKAALYARALRVALLGNFAAGFFLSQAYSPGLWMIFAICCAFTRVTAVDNGLRRGVPRHSWRRASARQ
jgi:O-antigen ligase